MRVCGFSGELDLARVAADAVAVAQMTDTMADRGPDGAGLWAQGPVALGHRRLKIIDLSERAAQPMVDADLGVTIVFNGCIYNHHELRRELEAAGHRFFSTGDTEVIVKAYRHWGDSFVEHLTGMFAFCLVERDSGRVVLGRDRLGIKPLYLAEVGGKLRFASTLPALLAGGGVDTSIDPGGAPPVPDVPLGRAGARAPSCGGCASCRRRRCWSSSPTAAATRPPTGAPSSAAGPSTRAGPPTTGRTPSCRRCAPRSTGAWSPTCRSGACCRAGSTRASSSACWPRPGSATCSRSASASSRTAASRATSSAGPTWWPSGSPPTTTASASRATACCRRWAAPSRP